MKSKLKFLVLSLIIVVFFTNCNKDEDDNQTPISGSPTNNAPAFNNIYISNGKLYIEYGQTYTFENYNSSDSSNYVIKNDTLFLYNIQSFAHIRIHNLKSLTVQNWGNAYFTNPFQIEDSLYIYLSSGSTLIDTIFSGGNLRIEDYQMSDTLFLNLINLNKLDLKLDYFGDVKCNGNIDSLKIEKRNYDCEFYGFDMQTNNANILTKYSGDIKVRVNNYLNAIIKGSGDIYYKGYPTIDLTDTGSGELIDAN